MDSVITRIVTAVRRSRCEHEVRLDDIHRVSDDEVIGRCTKCGKVLVAPYGLALPAKLTR